MFGLLLVGLLVLTGCGGTGSSLNVQYVEGVITLDGEPLEGATITFISQGAGGQDAGGLSAARGIYKLTSPGGDPERGTLVGEYAVTIRKIEIEGGAADPDSYTAVPVKQKDILPAVYRDRKNTPLTASVVKGKNRLNFDLTSNP